MIPKTISALDKDFLKEDFLKEIRSIYEKVYNVALLDDRSNLINFIAIFDDILQTETNHILWLMRRQAQEDFKKLKGDN